MVQYVISLNNHISDTVDQPVRRAIGLRPKALEELFGRFGALMSELREKAHVTDSNLPLLKTAVQHEVQTRTNRLAELSMTVVDDSTMKELRAPLERARKFIGQAWYSGTLEETMPRIGDYVAPSEQTSTTLGTIDFMNPLQILREAIKAVPAVRYALAVAGVVSVVAIAQAFRLDFRVALLGTIFVFILMTVMVVFANLSRTTGSSLHSPALTFTWFSIILTMVTATFLFTSVFFQWPVSLSHWLGPLSASNDSGRVEHGEEVRFQFDNTGGFFGVYMSGMGSVRLSEDAIYVTIESGEIRRNPELDRRQQIKYISMGLARSDGEGWTIKSMSRRHEVNWTLASVADRQSLAGHTFSIPILDERHLQEGWLVVDLSDGEGHFYAHTNSLF